jgi:hypothetical protein
MKNLRFMEKSIIVVAMIVLIFAGFFLMTSRKVAMLDSEVMAAVENPTPGSPGYMMVNLPLPGSFTTGADAKKVRFKMPWPATLLGFSAIVKTTGSTGTMAVDLLKDGVSVLSAPVSLNADTVTEGTIATSSMSDESIIAVKTTVSGGTWTDPTVQIIFKRK